MLPLLNAVSLRRIYVAVPAKVCSFAWRICLQPAGVPGPARDALLLVSSAARIPHGKQIDGMGGGTSSTSKVVIIAPSAYPNHDVIIDGQVAIEGVSVSVLSHEFPEVVL